jgi:hypothetical protein
MLIANVLDKPTTIMLRLLRLSIDRANFISRFNRFIILTHQSISRDTEEPTLIVDP